MNQNELELALKVSKELQMLDSTQGTNVTFPNWTPNWWPMMSPHLTNKFDEIYTEDVDNDAVVIRLRKTSEHLWKNKGFSMSFRESGMRWRQKPHLSKNSATSEGSVLENTGSTGLTPSGNTTKTQDDRLGMRKQITSLEDWSVIGESLDLISTGRRNTNDKDARLLQMINSWHMSSIEPNVSIEGDEEDKLHCD